MRTVLPANRYRAGELNSLGTASNMLIRQYRFPNTYSEKDYLINEYSDRLLDAKFEHTRECFKKYTGTGEDGLGNWALTAPCREIKQFLIEVLKASANVKWTGFRILGTVNRSNGQLVWSLELFSRNPETKTKVYSGATGPNVRSSESR